MAGSAEHGGLALARMADAMLRALGGTEVILLFPSGANSGTATELGIETTPVEELRIGPVCRLNGSSTDGRRRTEFMFSAAVVGVHMAMRGVESAQDFFASALGIVQNNTLLRIESVMAERFGDSDYLYRVMAVD